MPENGTPLAKSETDYRVIEGLRIVKDWAVSTALQARPVAGPAPFSEHSQTGPRTTLCCQTEPVEAARSAPQITLKTPRFQPDRVTFLL